MLRSLYYLLTEFCRSILLLPKDLQWDRQHSIIAIIMLLLHEKIIYALLKLQQTPWMSAWHPGKETSCKRSNYPVQWHLNKHLATNGTFLMVWHVAGYQNYWLKSRFYVLSHHLPSTRDVSRDEQEGTVLERNSPVSVLPCYKTVPLLISSPCRLWWYYHIIDNMNLFWGQHFMLGLCF